LGAEPEAAWRSAEYLRQSFVVGRQSFASLQGTKPFDRPATNDQRLI
jgi:hypothetical protein